MLVPIGVLAACTVIFGLSPVNFPYALSRMAAMLL
jgi:hypothetical protein